jgi:hypothetical protein
MKKNDYTIYEQPYELNIVGIRKVETQPNKFDDKLFVFYKDDSNQWVVNEYPITTDPGTYWLENPMSSMGTAMLKEGQWIDSYEQGFHKGQYLALRQAKPLTVYRDYDRNATFDIGTNESTGIYGINIHKAGEDSQDVNKWSAGCQVFQKKDDFDKFMALTNIHRDKYGNKYTYTLIDERAVKRRRRRVNLYVGLTSTFILGVAIGISVYLRRRNK